MDQHPTVDQNLPPISPGEIASTGVPSQPEVPVEVIRQPLHFPGDDGGKSLIEMAQRDLDATLQLLAERARYITGASGVAIALREGEEMTCRASVGRAAPAVGTRLEVGAGLSGECVRTRQVLRCDNAQSDVRVNREICRDLGIASALVMPLLREQQVNGVFELLSSRAHAFEERDATALQRLGEMIQTAVDHAEAAKQARSVIAGDELTGESAAAPHGAAPVAASASAGMSLAGSSSVAGSKTSTGAALAAEAENLQALLAEHGSVNNCKDCGFPVSGGRKLCLDCETARPPRLDHAAESAIQKGGEDISPATANPIGPEPSWLQSHKYMLGTLLVAAIGVAVVVWLR
jgi:putative methionine-R-sulfoxide reductase with GAF domain